MKVLHLPSNIASQISVSVRALRDIGIDARGLVKTSHLTEDTQNIEVLPPVTAGRYSINRMIQKISVWRTVLDALKWSDVIHWHYRGHVLPMGLDLRYAAFSNKARIVEFWGSDIRIPELASADNPYIAQMYRLYPEQANGKREKSLKAQRRFARYGFECLVPDSELESYIQKDIWPSPYRSKQRLTISDFDPKHPEPGKKRPLIVHVPSHKGIKGTKAILHAIDKLKSMHDFEFKLIHGVTHSKVIQIVRDCDIMLDQFVLGAHGVAALEAMAFGKPTLCYIKPSLVPKYPDDLPIINANQENLAEVLAGLLENGQMRHEVGWRSRAYVEKYHDAHKIARDLVVIYQDLLEKVRKSSGTT